MSRRDQPAFRGLARGALAVAGGISVTIGAINAVLALVVETCTQGDAGSLYGGVITLALYAVGMGALIAARPHAAYLVALLPTAIIALWHSWFALKLIYGYVFLDMSACFAMNGGFTPAEAGEWMDGSEPFFIILWVALSCVFWIGAVKLFQRERREWQRRKDNCHQLVDG